MTMNSCLYRAQVLHHRKAPKKHRFTYQITYWFLDLDELETLAKTRRFFSRNRANLLAFYDTDHGDGSTLPLKQQVRQKLVAAGESPPDAVRLLCLPRMLGYVFNPLSVYYCYRHGQLYALLYEVNNTFGERHTYVIPCGHDVASGEVVYQQATKRMHVSPFMAMDYDYRFSVKPPERTLRLGITMVNQKGAVFHASMTGHRHTLSDGQMIKHCLLTPWMTIKVMVGILWQAGKLYLKGLTVFRHSPRTPPVDSSQGAAGFQHTPLSRIRDGFH
ncbi:DUF1365 domain-containing protein [Candidatus Sororendozoicomonas aggregata]|uniref:DUF1365 domain-containing protein n=1 Tax=Candidatus Sororendozoicomonas aggregata TaxID=3073239 RepID=UPI002ED3FAE1